MVLLHLPRYKELYPLLIYPKYSDHRSCTFIDHLLALVFYQDHRDHACLPRSHYRLDGFQATPELKQYKPATKGRLLSEFCLDIFRPKISATIMGAVISGARGAVKSVFI